MKRQKTTINKKKVFFVFLNEHEFKNSNQNFDSIFQFQILGEIKIMYFCEDVS